MPLDMNYVALQDMMITKKIANRAGSVPDRIASHRTRESACRSILSRPESIDCEFLFSACVSTIARSDSAQVSRPSVDEPPASGDWHRTRTIGRGLCGMSHCLE